MNTSSAMESNFTLDQANYVGRLESSFLAEVCRMEEGVLQSARLMPYLRVMLTQDGGATIMDAIAIGNFYHVEKYVYKKLKFYDISVRSGTFTVFHVACLRSVLVHRRTRYQVIDTTCGF
ncbi:hypothetical protein Fcan01_20129 [Folsomia candida]|uniref:Uncharacterized protein n=1 Tax=Folsomia candida TaxID=158441 RepID=A0A226DJ59_FOLCA|nr:hypothetical protein Fcan01_20129 [Folsomia candida]